MKRPFYYDLEADIVEDAPICRITRNLYLGGAAAATDEKLLDSRNIQAILNLTEKGQVKNQFSSKYIYHNIPLSDDDDHTDFTAHFTSACNFIHRRRMQNKAVLVHCVWGRLRSAKICAIYLMFAYRMKWYDALERVRRKRAVVPLNPAFLWQLSQRKPYHKRKQSNQS